MLDSASSLSVGQQILRVTIAGIGVVLNLIDVGEAQSSLPNTFYQRNFAQAPQVGESPLPQEPIARAQSESKASTAQVEVVGGQVGEVARGQDGSKQQVKTFVSVYVASNNKAHFELVVRQALRLAAANRNIRLTEIYHIGDFHNVSEEISTGVATKGIVLAALDSVPAIWPVKESPVWILRDGEGAHIIEGVIDIGRFISPQGDYLSDVGAQIAVHGTPTAVIGGF